MALAVALACTAITGSLMGALVVCRTLDAFSAKWTRDAEVARERILADRDVARVRADADQAMAAADRSVARARVEAEEKAADAARLVAEREVMVREREIDLKEHQAEKPKAAPDMPDDLKERINLWEDDWAKNDERLTILALFAEFGDWDVVRQKLVPMSSVRDASDAMAPPRMSL